MLQVVKWLSKVIWSWLLSILSSPAVVSRVWFVRATTSRVIILSRWLGLQTVQMLQKHLMKGLFYRSCLNYFGKYFICSYQIPLSQYTSQSVLECVGEISCQFICLFWRDLILLPTLTFFNLINLFWANLSYLTFLTYLTYFDLLWPTLTCFTYLNLWDLFWH